MLFLRKGKTIGLNNKTHTNQQNPLFPNKWGMPDSVKVALHLMLYDTVTASKQNCSYFSSWIKSTRAEKFPRKVVVNLLIFLNNNNSFIQHCDIHCSNTVFI